MCYLLLIIVNLLLCLVYKISFIISIYVHRKNQDTGIYRFGTIHSFRHPLGGLGIYPLPSPLIPQNNLLKWEYSLSCFCLDLFKGFLLFLAL